MEFANTDLQFVSRLLEAILYAVLPILAGALVNWAIKAAKVQAGKLDQQTLATLLWVASVAVKAAEQANLAGYITDKKLYATEYAEKWMLDHGIKIDLATLEGLIEAAVMDEFGKAKIELEAKKQLVTPQAMQ